MTVPTAPTSHGQRGRDLIIRLRGGAGNQLFQYAAARSLVPPEQILAVRSATVGQLSIETLLPGRLLFTETLAGRPGTQRRRFQHLRRVGDAVRHRVPALQRRQLYSQHAAFDLAFEEKPRKFVVPRVLDGYFQHPSWYEPGVKAVMTELIEDAPAGFRTLLQGPAYAVVCVRRGDYEPLGQMLQDSYYARCLQQLDPSLPVAFVGDDQAYLATLAEHTRQAGRVIFDAASVADDPAVHDFWVIAAATSVAMANSTFCWWATSVGDQCRSTQGRAVLFPEGWLRGHGEALRASAWAVVGGS